MDCIGLIGIAIAIGALFVAILARNISVKSLKLNIFSSLLKEIADEDARKDRALVNKIQGNEREDIQRLIEPIWKDEKNDDTILGNAAERTIARLDRVGFFLLGKGNHPATDSPEWLWTIVKDMWGKLGNWVIYRQTCKEKPIYHKGYGLYFQKLYDYGIKYNLIEKQEVAPHAHNSG